MLRLFEKAYLKGEPKAMAHCAQTLLEFNGGSSCIQIYVNQHDFFISRDRIEAVDYVAEAPMWESLADPNQAAPKTEPQLAALYSDIRDQISQEAQIIEVVFPHPVVVMQVFLQRVFAQVIQSHLEKLINAAQGSSTLAFLRVLALARFSTAQLVNDIKAHDFFRSSSSISSSTTETYTLARRGSDDADVDNKASVGVIQAISGGPGISALSSMLDQQLEELFGQHLDNSRYVERECKSLTELYASYLLQFARWHRATNKAKPTNTIFDRMVNQISSSANGTPGTTQTSGLKSLLKLSGISADDSANPLNEELPTTPELCESDGQLDLNVAEKLLTWHAESVGRMIELSSPSEVPKNVFSLLKTLAESFCKGYIETALETSLAQFSSYDFKAEPSLKPMTVIKTADMAMHLWQRYVTTAIVPLAAVSVNIRREMSIFNNHILVRIENKINSVAQKALECVLSWLSISLAKQKKLDFKPKNDELDFSRTHTEACAACTEFLNTTRTIVNQSLSGKNSEIFLSEVGVVFHSFLLEHLKKFPVSAMGGLMLTKDLTMYQDTIAKFNIPGLNERYEMIRELGNIFVVQPSILKSYLGESAMLGRIDGKLLRPFFLMRVDYGDHPKKFWDEVVGESKHHELGAAGAQVDRGLWLGITGA
ncbi:Exocyst complex component 5 [Puccinia graminis f. sp. tritici]|nr:Exocyst complex component 5 [Puccinia graminis f. sp. tritici]